MIDIRVKLARLVEEALKSAIAKGALSQFEVPEVQMERPREKAHGDWATNIALTSAARAKLPPRKLAETIVENLPVDASVSGVEVAGPGFINFRLSNAWLHEVVRAVDVEGESFGRSNFGGGLKVNLEFVSANPVGPMHVGHGRWAAVGDTLANVFSATGHDVTREFYINDYGSQMNIFASSVAARYAELLGAEVEFPENGYRGEYIRDIAREIISRDGDGYLSLSTEEREAIFKETAYRQVLTHIKKTLHTMGVDFDIWFSERTIHESTEIKKTIDFLRKRGYIYEAEGATWFKAKAFGEEKDRVLIRENGEPTYFAADIAYHKDKLDRGYDLMIDIWGADHHGYVARMKAAVQALGHPRDKLEVILGQLVNLMRGGEPVRMSKRTGEMVTLDELVDEVGRDAVRFLFLMRSTDTALDFDIELAKEKSNENPVYYVQYAHARISSILRYAAEESAAANKSDYSLLNEAPELDLIRKIAEWPEVLEGAARIRSPHFLTRYAHELASSFHYFYTRCRVVTEDAALTAARIGLVKTAQTLLRIVLKLLGVSAPERM
ncbi:MAG: arginine--tRNA ligase [Actinobacteria bacterium]|nr:arginine--tRNA ligase [Actinomycetota bacterium]